MKTYAYALIGLLLATSSAWAGKPAQPVPYKPGMPIEEQATTDCCDDDDGSILDEFDDKALWHRNAIYVGKNWLAADGRPVLELMFECTGSPCVIKESLGGGLLEFALAAKAAQYTNTRIIVDGDCRSACVLFADIARAQVCLGPNAKLGVHKWLDVKWTSDGVSYWPEILASYDPIENDDVVALVRANGGFPENGINILPLAAALSIWRPCTTDR